MENSVKFMENLKSYGVGRRKLDDILFINDKPPARLGVYEMDDENLCHEVVRTRCTIPGCVFSADSLLEFEDHYNSSHRYSCAQCKKILPSPHFLDLHLQEKHDSFFAVMSEKKPSYCCYIEECKEKFMTADERHDHCIKLHKLPKDFRFEQNPKKARNRKKANENQLGMDVDPGKDTKTKVTLSNNKQKTFSKYTGRKFTQNQEHKNKTDVTMDITVDELKESLPN